MKPIVGILSMQRVINYGSFLQAYALKSILQKLGAECYFLDVEPGYQLKGNKIDNLVVQVLKRYYIIMSKLITNFRQTLLVRKYSKQIKKRFVEDYYRLLELEIKFHNRFDLVVIGSDEVFNCTQKSNYGFSKQLFGSGIDSEKVISYAASFGATTLDAIDKFDISEELSEYLSCIDDISVRDENSQFIVERLTDNRPKRHLDPVLIYNFESELKRFEPAIEINDYIIVYTYVNRIKDPSEVDAICSFAKKQNKKLISIFCAYTWCERYIVPETPFSVLSYFKQADYIITDTFHGVVFSILSRKKFGVIERKSNRQKIHSLLKFFNLEDRLILKNRELENMMTLEINYAEIDKMMSEEKRNAIDYLRKHLSEFSNKKM